MGNLLKKLIITIVGLFVNKQDRYIMHFHGWEGNTLHGYAREQQMYYMAHLAECLKIMSIQNSMMLNMIKIVHVYGIIYTDNKIKTNGTSNNLYRKKA